MGMKGTSCTLTSALTVLSKTLCNYQVTVGLPADLGLNVLSSKLYCLVPAVSLAFPSSCLTILTISSFIYFTHKQSLGTQAVKC